MTTVLLDSENPRCAKAILLAVEASTWKRQETREGKTKFLVPSQTETNVFYLCDTTDCGCVDAKRGNTCKHQIAVAIFLVLEAASQTKVRPRKHVR